MIDTLQDQVAILVMVHVYVGSVRIQASSLVYACQAICYTYQSSSWHRAAHSYMDAAATVRVLILSH